MQEDDERYAALLSFLEIIASLQVEKRWTEWRRKHEVEKAKETSPALSEWFETLPEGFRKSAETLVSKLSALPVDEEDDRKLLVPARHPCVRADADSWIDRRIHQASVHDVDKLLTVLADRDALEASLYRDIVKSRLDAIKDFQGIVDEDAKERVLQQYLFDHLWLLDPAWERATQSEIMESRLIAKKA